MTACPACGGSGGGPFGRLGSAWDVDGYECPRCRGAGVVTGVSTDALAEPRPLARAAPRRPDLVADKRGLVSTRPAAKAVTRTANGNKK
ncbi:MAG TPA: hypothetical protein VII82_14065 [Polyangiaceae bacterium]